MPTTMANVCVLAAVVTILLLLAHHLPSPPTHEDPTTFECDLSKMAKDLVDAARARYPSIASENRIVDVRPMPEPEIVDHVRKTVRRGKYARSDGTIYVALKRRNAEDLPLDVVVGILVHEVAHALTSGSHTAEWRDMFSALLRTATEDLGWTVRLECSACKTYGICQPQQCPKCDWDECRSPRGPGVKSTG
jgi:hypothetical protein